VLSSTAPENPSHPVFIFTAFKRVHLLSGGICEGAKFWFTSEEHRNTFRKNPEKYAPQYGGYCAFAMAMKNTRVPSDPRTFKLYNGKLYLFFNDYYEGTPFNTIIPWNADEANMKQKADANWSHMAH